MTATAAFALVTSALAALEGIDAEVYDGPVLSQAEPASYVIIGGQGWADDDDPVLLTREAWDDCPVNIGPLTFTNVQVTQELLDPGMAVRITFDIDARAYL